ncbi:MAG: pantetheine-phosphate adenylyltransferase [Pelotomaculum sp.]|uniref:Phosphopantetheine adenylyltransferase n=1 Tax=Pelotomaculum thermopropionicum (strain DSM 13744 / JCM 10971 / SI) TaxID=370438 RepID=A5D1F7_PELTS|nr:pantetheine-phosphate adenylyltransferase [Pelotomaculum sp.]BAF59934.1 phosphopantetheine adenylyltransferase [Pelotomaculum thermopropionicum SI]
MRIAICPGSFDPVTYGHLDIIGRASILFDKIIVAVSRNPTKNPIFSIEERVEMLKEVLKSYNNVEVDSFEGLTVNYAIERKAKAIVRGLRVISDFENEFRMALTNKKLACHIETVFLMTRAEFSYISSTTVKEVASFGGSVRSLVPPLVEERLKEKFKNASYKVRRDIEQSGSAERP